MGTEAMTLSEDRIRQVNILTVDLEDWAQSTVDHALPISPRVVENTRRLMKLFAKHEVTATFFVLGLVAQAYPKLVREVAEAGHEIATHGFNHEQIFKLKPEEFAADVQRAVRVTEDIIGEKVVGYRAPDFSITRESLWALDVLAEQGIKYDSSIFPIRSSRYGIPSSPRFPYRVSDGLYEIPLTTVRIGAINFPVCGGGYFRLAPYWLTRWAMRRVNAERHPAVVYVHPYELDATEFDEIDVKISHRLRLSQGVNRRKTAAKLETLLGDFQFLPIRQVIPFES